MARGYWDAGWRAEDDEAAFTRAEGPDPEPDIPDPQDIDWLLTDRDRRRAKQKTEQLLKQLGLKRHGPKNQPQDEDRQGESARRDLPGDPVDP